MATLDINGTVALFDDEDFDLISKHKWFITPQGYAVTKIKRTDGLKIDSGRITIGMHRLILGYSKMPAIDHINRNKMDNRKENLRACTVSENNRNIPTVKGKVSAHRGVSRHRDKWQVVIRINGILTNLGTYLIEEEAAFVAAPYFAAIVS